MVPAFRISSRGGWLGCALLLLLSLLTATDVIADPVRVRYAEGVARGFPVIRDLKGERLASGELTQIAREGVVTSEMIFRFRDGSLYHETVVFSQNGVFTLQRYELIQKGPSFPETVHATMDRSSGRVRVRYQEDADSPEQTIDKTMDLPPDVYNGMLSLILRNLGENETATVKVLAFAPRPMAVVIQVRALREEPVQMGDAPRSARVFSVKPQLGLFASLLITDIPDFRFWMLTGTPPAFVKFEGPMYFLGPVWRIDWN